MKDVIGSVIIPTTEGSRSILVEAQALVTDTVFSTPSRRCTGIDQIGWLSSWLSWKNV